MRRCVVWLLFLAVFFPLPLRAGELQDDLKARRARLMERLGPEAVMIVWSAPKRTYSRNINYRFRQDSNLYYLTGIDQEQTTLVLMPGNETRKEILFVAARDPVREHWDGEILSREEAAARSGIGSVYLASEFEKFVDAVLSRTPYDIPRYTVSREYDTFFKALAGGTAWLALIFEPKPGLTGPLGPTQEFANRVRERFPDIIMQDVAHLMRDLRVIKTPYEQRVLERSVEISSDAHLAGMRAARPGAWEYEVEAAIEYVFRARGAHGWSYPSIVGSGPNATVLHYHKSSRRMNAGDLLLVDAAANYEYLTGDITRTYPVSGVFTAEQKDLYRVVLSAQEEGRKVARPGESLAEIHARTVEVIKEGLLRLGLITDASGDQYRTWYTHGASHYIGMDVHDVGDRQQPLEPGMTFVIEPGLYIREGALEHLPNTPENREFRDKVRPAYEKYKNLGIRVEDSFLMTDAGLKCLSENVPRTIEEIESFMRTRKPFTAER